MSLRKNEIPLTFSILQPLKRLFVHLFIQELIHYSLEQLPLWFVLRHCYLKFIQALVKSWQASLSDQLRSMPPLNL